MTYISCRNAIQTVVETVLEQEKGLALVGEKVRNPSFTFYIYSTIINILLEYDILECTIEAPCCGDTCSKVSFIS